MFSGRSWYWRLMLSLDKAKNDTSAAMDILRTLAAQAVCVGHGLSFFQVPRPAGMPLIQNVGVLLFFIMSGFLITSTLFKTETFTRYFIDRFARIYSGLIPALGLIVIIDGITIWLTGEPTISRYYNFKTLLANLAMFESYRGIGGQSLLQWPAFGSASPLWTLGIEWHIYMFAGAVFFILKGRWWLIPVALFFSQTPLHYLLGGVQADGVGSGLFSLWLSGAVLYLFFSAYTPPIWASACVLVFASAAYCLGVTPGREYELATYPALVLIVGSLIGITQRTKQIRAFGAIRIAAGYSFTLYLIHHTIMMAVVAFYPRAEGWAWFAAVVFGSNLIAYLIAQPAEMKHKQLARWLASLPVSLREKPGTQYSA
jgi:peptidoglycan/LPS O-acetylase OafA/YrhL